MLTVLHSNGKKEALGLMNLTCMVHLVKRESKSAKLGAAPSNTVATACPSKKIANVHRGATLLTAQCGDGRAHKHLGLRACQRLVTTTAPAVRRWGGSSTCLSSWCVCSCS